MTANDPQQKYEDAIQTWHEKLGNLQMERAIVASPEQKFELDVRIRDCQEKIAELKRIISDTKIPSASSEDDNRLQQTCSNNEELSRYLDAVIPRLRDRFGFLDIQNNVKYKNRSYKYIARKRRFEVTLFKDAPVPNYRGEAFFIFSEFYQLTMDVLREFRHESLSYVENMATTNRKSWESLLELSLNRNFCFSVALVDKLDLSTKERILTENPVNYSGHREGYFEMTAVYELNSKQLLFYQRATNFWDSMYGEAAWQRLRPIVEETLSP